MALHSEGLRPKDAGFQVACAFWEVACAAVHVMQLVGIELQPNLAATSWCLVVFYGAEGPECYGGAL